MNTTQLNYIAAQQRVAEHIRHAERAELASQASPRQRSGRAANLIARMSARRAGSTARCAPASH